MPYTVGCTPAPLTITVQSKFDWRFLPSVAWFAFIAYDLAFRGWRHLSSDNLVYFVLFGIGSLAAVLSVIRGERIEIYPDKMAWRRTYFGITHSRTASLADVVGAEWTEGRDNGDGGKGPDFVEFYLPNGSVKACFGFTFDDFDRMRQDIRTMYPALIERWGSSKVRSKDFTLLNLS